MKKEKVVYIDADVLAYAIGFATEYTVFELQVEGTEDGPLFSCKGKRELNKIMKENPHIIPYREYTHVEPPIAAIHTLKLSIQAIVEGSGATDYKVVLSGKTNFRDQIATIQPYKGNREDSAKPQHWAMLREWLMEKPYTIVSDGEEADDVISKAMMQGHIGATVDKDLNNTPGWHYNWNKQPMERLYHVDEETALRNFYTQCLTGDTADNIPGIKGIGPIKAQKILMDCRTKGDYEQAILEVYEQHYDLPLAALTEVGQLLWMRRYDNEMYYPVTATV